VGPFGIGEVHLGISEALYACVPSVLVTPGLAFIWGYLLTAGGLPRCLQSLDIFRMADRSKEELER